MKLLSKRAALHMGVMTAALALAGAALPAQAAAPAKTTAAYSHQTAPTQFITIDGAKIAYRRFGKPGGVPLVFFQHFVGTMDNWDPKITDGLARDREVILFDNAGVADSGGQVPTSIDGMAQFGIGLINALGLKSVDLLGFSTGSLVAQQVTLDRPDLVRRLVLIGTSPRGGVGMAGFTPEFSAALAKPQTVRDGLLLDVFFTPSEKSQAAGRAFLTRLHARTVGRDSEINDQVAPRQAQAIAAWGAPSANANDYLKDIKQPVLVVEGSHDIVFYTVNGFTLQQHVPNAKLVIYPDSNHGVQYQYPDQFLGEVRTFLAGAN